MKQQPTPPKWLDSFLQWYCKPELLEDLQGDLHEYYARNLIKGKPKADLIFLIDVLKFFRPYTIQKPKFFRLMSFFFMFDNYLKTSTRTIVRNKLFSTINIVGLAISMSLGILMITFVSELLSYDKFHKNGDRMYRILSHYKGITDDEPISLASTSIFMGKKLEEDYAGIDKLVILRRNFNPDIKHGDNVISSSGIWSSSQFFDVFSFEMVSGNPTSALEEPNSIVISESLAQKLFKDENPVGKQVELIGLDQYNFNTAKVTGVVKDPPKNSHMQFEVIASMKTLEKYAEGLGKETTLINQYSSVWMNYVYMLLPENQGPELVQGHLDQIAKEEGAKFDRFAIHYELESLHDIMPGRDLSNQIGPTTEWAMIYIIGGLALIVIISACFNYTNLSIARSLRRAKEVGIRKIAGAGRSHVFSQFIMEAVLISLMALVLAFGLFQLIKPEFLKFTNSDGLASLDFQWKYIPYFFAFAIIIGILAGFLPSLFLSKLKAITVLKDPSKVRLFGGVSLRKMLIVFQFALSICFIIGTTISYRQYQFALGFDLGFSTDNILNVELKGNDPDKVKAEFAKIPGVQAISVSGLLPAMGEIWSATAKFKDPMDSAKIYINYVDVPYLGNHDYEFVAGGNFPTDVKKDDPQKFIIINEKLAERFHFDHPQDAIGEVLTIDTDEKLQIVGVVRDFQHQTISGGVEPFAFMQQYENYNWANLKVQTTDAMALMDKLESTWRIIDPVHSFQAEFYSVTLQKAYEDFQAYFKVIGFLAILAISIATMGLLGMAVFTIETRTKEISIRKVLGATGKNLIILLSKGFIVMVLIAAAIAVPVTYLIFENMVLAEFVNRINIGVVELLSGVVVILCIAVATIGWQTSIAIRTNPADMLRNE